jgi:carbamate kinase
VIVTDVDAVYSDWGTPEQHAIRSRDTGELGLAVRRGPRWLHGASACWFAETQRRLRRDRIDHDTQALLRGEVGTRVALDAVRTG